MRVLVVEDEIRLAALLDQGLQEEGFAVDTAGSAEAALDWIESTPYDLLLLDLMLPGMSGIELCRRWRAQRNTTPILVLTARDAVPDEFGRARRVVARGERCRILDGHARNGGRCDLRSLRPQQRIAARAYEARDQREHTGGGDRDHEDCQ